MKINQSAAEHTTDPEFCLGTTLLYINPCNNAKRYPFGMVCPYIIFM